MGISTLWLPLCMVLKWQLNYSSEGCINAVSYPRKASNRGSAECGMESRGAFTSRYASEGACICHCIPPLSSRLLLSADLPCRCLPIQYIISRSVLSRIHSCMDQKQIFMSICLLADHGNTGLCCNIAESRSHQQCFIASSCAVQ